MKNMEDAYAIGDHIINDKSLMMKPGREKIMCEADSILHWSLFQYIKRPPLFLYCPHHTTEYVFAARVAALEKKLSNLKQTNKNLDNTTRNLRSRVYTLELRDLPHKINEAVRENVKEAVQIALQDPLRDRFRDLSEEDMKEMLHQRMFETGSYKSLSEHIALYEALEASMERTQRDELLAKMDKSQKQRRDDQGPPPPPLPDSDPSKKRRHDSSALGSSQPPAPQSSSWKAMTLTIEDIPMPETANLSDLEGNDSDHLPKTKQRPEWLKPIPDDERLATPEPAWVIPTSHIPNAENNWANALATTYQALAKNSLLEKTGDMQTFMKWYCQKMGKTELTQADLEGQACEVVKPFYLNVVHLQFQMEECHKMLTDQIEWTNPECDQVRIDISKPLPLSGPPGHVTIQTQFFFNKDLDYLRYGSKESRHVLSISKMKAACYLDFGLELRVPVDTWINEVCTYDISAYDGISHSVSIKAYSRYGYDYLKEITLRRADYQEYTIAERDFKNLYPSDFEDLNMLPLTRGLKDFQLHKIVFPVSNNEREIMRFIEIYKFSDVTNEISSVRETGMAGRVVIASWVHDVCFPIVSNQLVVLKHMY
ncbi:hypothetical protein Tco_1404912 [Tanacetum coccineum]